MYKKQKPFRNYKIYKSFKNKTKLHRLKYLLRFIIYTLYTRKMILFTVEENLASQSSRLKVMRKYSELQQL